MIVFGTTGCPGQGPGPCGGGQCHEAGAFQDAATDRGGGDGQGEAGAADGGQQQDAAKPPGFKKGNIYVAGSRNAEVFELSPTLKVLNRWTHPSFGTVLPPPGQSLSLGPAGMAFNAKGYLVVAGVKDFCVFSAPKVVEDCHAKVKQQPTENIIFDHLGNVYTTTSTGGTNEVHKYDASFKFLKTFSIKTGELTGITCDPKGDLFIASQDKGKGHVYKVDRKTLAVLDTIDVTLTGVGSLEGLQYLKDGSILVATFGGSQGVLRIKGTSPFTLLRTFKAAGMYGPVPVTIDTAENIYTADYENGSGTAPADLFVFDPAGKIVAQYKASPVYGPFGMVVAGAVLPCGAFRVN